MHEGQRGEEADYQIGLVPGSSIALFRWIGPITLQDRFSNLTVMTEFCKSHSVRKIIIDGRDQVVSGTNLADAHDFASEVPAAFRDLQVAVVHRPDDDCLCFIETVASNRGAGTKPFLDIEEAREWLEAADKPEDGKPPESER